MRDPSVFILIVLFGAIGLGFFVYGTRQRVIVPLFVGVSLLVFPYFIANLYLLLVVGIMFIALPYFIRL